MENLIVEQAEIIKNFSFSIVQESSVNYTLTILYKKKVIFRKSTQEIYDYWDWIENAPMEFMFLFPDNKFDGNVDFNVYDNEDDKTSQRFNLTLYGVNENGTVSDNDYIRVGEVSIAIEFTEKKPIVPYLDYIDVFRLYKSNSWIATAHRIYIGEDKSNLRKILGQTFGQTEEQALKKCKATAGFKKAKVKRLSKDEYSNREISKKAKRENEIVAYMIKLKERTIRDENIVFTERFYHYVNHQDKLATSGYDKKEILMKNRDIVRFDRITYILLRERYDSLFPTVL